ncbi:MAG: hypothetical protein J6Q53_04790 [Oscillospiraceae bacterium]|nr:hypothetical protein [Oscillospiraceae bacterium]
MANLYDTGANSAFNEDKYINKIYDSTLDSQNKVLTQGYEDSVNQLNAGQQQTREQTSDYVKRAYVEGQRAAGTMEKSAAANPAGVGTNAQARLMLGNQNQVNKTTLQNQQNLADQEYERQRQLRGQWYAAEIKKAQANNDMNRAQALYSAAQAEEAQMRSFRQNAAVMMQKKGDSSILDAIAKGEAVTPDTTSETWDSVLKNEDSINKIYDAQLESQKQDANLAYAQSLSDLIAKQAEAQRETDKNLTATYVDALRKGRNYQEVQSAYGQGSGTAMQARLARESGLAKKLTDLRTLQLGRDAAAQQDRAGLVHTLGSTIAAGQETINNKRNQALYDAAEKEEQNLVSDQLFVGEQLAKKGDYSVLGKLYGLTPEQMKKFKRSSSGGGAGTISYRTWLANLSNADRKTYKEAGLI